MPNDEFVAISVGEGDAFFLRRRGESILVDGGGSVERFPSDFKRVTGCRSIDIVVCTHNHADHAGGILWLLKKKFPIQELWLPAVWFGRLADLRRDSGEFLEEVAENIIEVSHDGCRGEFLEQRLAVLGDRLSQRIWSGQSPSDEPAVREEETVDPSPADERIGEFEEYFEREDLLGYPGRVGLLARFPGLRDDRLALLAQAFLAAERIRRIDEEAGRLRIKVKWFAYNKKHKSGGIPGILEPVNSIEVDQPRTSRLSALAYLALTMANRESLVFYSPASVRAPGILFSADSDFSFNQPLPSSPAMIITVPHHGSESNARAYEPAGKGIVDFGGSTWVRSDGEYRRNPGPSFLKLRQRRFCTRCRVPPTGFTPDQNVRFNGMRIRSAGAQPSCWRKHPGTCSCRCS